MSIKDGLRETLSVKSYRMSRFLGADWRLDRIIASSDADETESIFHLNIRMDRSPQDTPKSKKAENYAFEMTADQMDLFTMNCKPQKRR